MWIDDWVLAVRGALDLIRPGSAGELWISNQPRSAVTRNVELRHNAYATIAGVVEECPNLCLRVVQALRALFVKFRKLFALDAKSFIVGQMPMQHVEFYGCHSIEVALQYIKWNEMTADIDQQTAPWEARLILNADCRNRETIGTKLNKLEECL